MRSRRRGRRESEVNVLFVCVGNAGRSPMAEAFFKRGGGDRYEAALGRHQVGDSNRSERDRRDARVGHRSLRARAPSARARRPPEWADLVVRVGCGDMLPARPRASLPRLERAGSQRDRPRGHSAHPRRDCRSRRRASTSSKEAAAPDSVSRRRTPSSERSLNRRWRDRLQ